MLTVAAFGHHLWPPFAILTEQIGLSDYPIFCNNCAKGGNNSKHTKVDSVADGFLPKRVRASFYNAPGVMRLVSMSHSRRIRCKRPGVLNDRFSSKAVYVRHRRIESPVSRNREKGVSEQEDIGMKIGPSSYVHWIHKLFQLKAGNASPPFCYNCPHGDNVTQAKVARIDEDSFEALHARRGAFGAALWLHILHSSVGSSGTPE